MKVKLSITQILAFSYYKIVFFFLKLFDLITRKSLLFAFKDVIRNNSYENILINGKLTKFFIPSLNTKYRLKNFFSKEPETINWINSFNYNEKKEIIFWDIGSNVGNYSIYAAQKFNNIKIISFEPSHSNLPILSRNISINNLSDKISIIQLPLADKENEMNLMQEISFSEGGSFNSFKENYISGNKNPKFINSYKILGTSIDYLIEKKILEIPNYIKIDVDGIEHLIIKGAEKNLSNNKIKGLLIEIYTDSKQSDFIFKVLRNNGFKLLDKVGFNHIFSRT